MSLAVRSLNTISNTTVRDVAQTSQQQHPANGTLDSKIRQKSQGDVEAIKVAVRLKPLSAEKDYDKIDPENGRAWRAIPEDNTRLFRHGGGGNGGSYCFDRVYQENSTSSEIYDDLAKNIVESVARKGINGTVFTYGQTSSGKTHTMQGLGGGGAAGKKGSAVDGIVHMAARDLFAIVEEDKSRSFVIRVSFLEIYNEDVRDLLVAGDRSCNISHNRTLNVREDTKKGGKGVFVKGLTEERVTNLEALLHCLNIGEKQKSVAATGMNERSSRSHTIFRVTVESRGNDKENVQSKGDSGGDGVKLVATLNLVDLAGSESVKQKGASAGPRQKEGANINKSLLALSTVVTELSKNSKGHGFINFRDSKLTRILQSSLSGNARMVVICCISLKCIEETKSTLQFATRAKLVKTRATANEVYEDPSVIKQLQRELSQRSEDESITLRKLRNAEEKLAKLISQKEAAEARAVALEADREDVLTERDAMVKEYETNLEEKDAEVKDARAKIEHVLNEKQEIDAEVASLRTEMGSMDATYRERLEGAQAEKEVADGRITELTGAVASLMLQHQESTEAISRLRDEKASFEAKVFELSSAKNKSERQAEEMVAELARVSLELTQSNCDKQKLAEELDASKDTIAELKKVNNELEENLSRLNHQQEGADALVQRLMSDANSAKEAAENLRTEKDNKISALASRIDAAEEKISSLSSEKEEEEAAAAEMAKAEAKRLEEEAAAAEMAHVAEEENAAAEAEAKRLEEEAAVAEKARVVEEEKAAAEDEAKLLEEEEEAAEEESATAEAKRLEEEAAAAENSRAAKEEKAPAEAEANHVLRSESEVGAHDNEVGDATSSAGGEEICPGTETGDFCVDDGELVAEEDDSLSGESAGPDAADHESSEAWEKSFASLVEFKRREGHCRVPRKHKEVKVAKLGKWADNQRQAKKRKGTNKISPSQIERLTTLGFVWDTRKEAWEENFSELVKYKREHGHCNVPVRHKDKKIAKLEDWVSTQRKAKKGNVPNKISPSQVERLNKLGFVWDVHKEAWEENFSDLVKYKKEHGHCNFSARHKDKKIAKLGRWLERQRRAKRRSRSDLIFTAEREGRLTELGVDWEPRAKK